MENEAEKNGNNLTEEHFERILGDLEGETPKVAEELYPDNHEEQEKFIENTYKAAILMGRGKDAELIEKEEKISTKQIERILQNPKKEASKIAQELYPNDPKKREDFEEYVNNNFYSETNGN